MLRDPPASDWLMWRRTYNGWGYSPLDQINKDNVKDLRPVWTWSMTPGPTETTPIVHDGVLFIFNFADKIQALNATNGDLIWEYKRDLPEKLLADFPRLGKLSLKRVQNWERDRMLGLCGEVYRG
jgi:alcohol dehydrogenase (cytochrome c)